MWMLTIVIEPLVHLLNFQITIIIGKQSIALSVADQVCWNVLSRTVEVYKLINCGTMIYLCHNNLSVVRFRTSRNNNKKIINK